MTEPVDRPEAAFEGLRLGAAPVAPRPGFAEALRRRLESALSPDTAPREEITVSDTYTDTTTTAGGGTTSSPASPLTPYLIVARATEAIDWYRDVLGGIETTRFVGDDGRVGHAELVIGGARLMLADEFPEMELVGPTARGGSSVTLHLEVVDVDHSYRLATEAGAVGQRPPADQGHGNRNATVVDPFGHRWMLSQSIPAGRAATATDPDGDVEGWSVSGRTPVEPGYLTMHTGDLDRARAFYGALFDWEVRPGNLPGGGHVANTRFPLGFMSGAAPAPDRSGPAVGEVRVYFRVDDIEPYATRVAELGGQVLDRVEHPSGANAECVDDQGFRFDLFRPAPGY